VLLCVNCHHNILSNCATVPAGLAQCGCCNNVMCCWPHWNSFAPSLPLTTPAPTGWALFLGLVAIKRGRTAGEGSPTVQCGVCCSQGAREGAVVLLAHSDMVLLAYQRGSAAGCLPCCKPTLEL
jgi:hypothetical protein